MALLIFNKGGDFDVTATATTGTDLVITLSSGAKSESYTVAGGANVTATATSFVSTHAQAISDTWKIFTSNAAGVLTFEGVDDVSFSVTGGTLGSADVTTERSVDPLQLTQVLVASATSLTLNYNPSTVTADVGTITFVSAADRKKFYDKYAAAVEAAGNGAPFIDINLGCKAVFA